MFFTSAKNNFKIWAFNLKLNVIWFLRKLEIIFLHKTQPMSTFFFLQIKSSLRAYFVLL